MDSKILYGPDRRLLVGVTLQSDRYRLGHLSVDLKNIRGWLNVQSGHCKLALKQAKGLHQANSAHVIKGHEKCPLGSMRRYNVPHFCYFLTFPNFFAYDNLKENLVLHILPICRILPGTPKTRCETNI